MSRLTEVIRGPRCWLAVALLLATGSAAEAQKLGVFDAQRISMETAEGKRVQAELTTIQNQKQNEIDAMQATINEAQRQLSQQALSLSSDKRTALELDIKRKILELNNANELASQELQLALAAAEARFNDKLRVVVDTFGRDEGFDVLVDRSMVAFASAQVDVTTTLIDRFDQLFPPGTGAE